MPQHEIEVILARQLASYLAVAVFVVDNDGTLLFYNEPGEEILGTRFEQTGMMAVDEWSTIFHPTDEDGNEIPPEELPLVITLSEGQPAHRQFFIRGLDGKPRRIHVTSFPLLAQGRRRLGAIAIFWEL